MTVLRKYTCNDHILSGYQKNTHPTKQLLKSIILFHNSDQHHVRFWWHILVLTVLYVQKHWKGTKLNLWAHNSVDEIISLIHVI